MQPSCQPNRDVQHINTRTRIFSSLLMEIVSSLLVILVILSFLTCLIHQKTVKLPTKDKEECSDISSVPGVIEAGCREILGLILARCATSVISWCTHTNKNHWRG